MEVTGLSSRTFAAWTVLAGVIRLQAAYDIHNHTYQLLRSLTLMDQDYITLLFGHLILRGSISRVSGLFIRLQRLVPVSSVPSSSQVLSIPSAASTIPLRFYGSNVDVTWQRSR